MQDLTSPQPLSDGEGLFDGAAKSQVIAQTLTPKAEALCYETRPLNGAETTMSGIEGAACCALQNLTF